MKPLKTNVIVLFYFLLDTRLKFWSASIIIKKILSQTNKYSIIFLPSYCYTRLSDIIKVNYTLVLRN